MPASPHASARQLLLRRIALLEATLVQHGVAVPEASAATRAACAVDAADEEGRTALDGFGFQTRPLYSGKPWFLPLAVAYYRWRDGAAT